jgi:hypothetical protein
MITLCEQCQIGRIRRDTAPFIIGHQGHVLVMPDAPVIMCDTCSYLEYDDDFLKAMYLMLRPRSHGSDAEESVRPPRQTRFRGATTGKQPPY